MYKRQDTGSVVWCVNSTEILDTFQWPIAGTHLYICSYDTLYCFNTENGVERWNISTGGTGTHLMIHGNNLYLGSRNAELYCVNADSGEQQWVISMVGNVYSSPAVVNGFVYFGASDGYVYCLDTETGEIVWRFKTHAQVRSSPAIMDGFLYIGSDDHYLYCLNIENGEMVWRFECGGEVRSSPACLLYTSPSPRD